MGYEFRVKCGIAGCEEAACYKVAAPWSDQLLWELKTYGFACEEHLQDVLRIAEARWLDYEPVKGEVVGYVAVYHYSPGMKDRDLKPVVLDEEPDEERDSGWRA